LKVIARLLRGSAKLRYRWLDLATIKDIPIARFNELIVQLRSNGWCQVSEYDGFDAWIDYGRIGMRRRGVRLRLEWDNWTGGSIEGPRVAIEEVAREHGLRVTYQLLSLTLFHHDFLALKRGGEAGISQDGRQMSRDAVGCHKARAPAPR
jgi:hypothetical protein